MSKKFGFDPFIILGMTPDDGDFSEKGSKQDGSDPVPGLGPTAVSAVSFDDFITMYYNDELDSNGNGAVDFEDYVAWWKANGLSVDDFARFNPDAVSTYFPMDTVEA